MTANVAPSGLLVFYSCGLSKVEEGGKHANCSHIMGPLPALALCTFSSIKVAQGCEAEGLSLISHIWGRMHV